MVMTLDSLDPPGLHVSREQVEQCRDYTRIEQAMYYLAAHTNRQPPLADVAAHAGLTEFHFQRVFSRWAGVSPKRFLQRLTLEEAKRALRESASVLDASLAAGLSGPGRLHDLFVTWTALTPGEYRARGAGLVLRYGFHETPFGECAILLSERGVVGLGFVSGDAREEALRELSSGWEEAALIEDPDATGDVAARVFSRGEADPGSAQPLQILVRGTTFQLRVWEALLRVPPGRVTTYQRIAAAAGCGEGLAARAAGNAIGRNPLAYIIPCHRVIRATGALGGYRWGEARKLAILGYEAAHIAAGSGPGAD